MGAVCCKADDPEGAGKGPNLVEVTTSGSPDTREAQTVQQQTASEVAAVDSAAQPAPQPGDEIAPAEGKGEKATLDNPDYWTVELTKSGGQRLACNIECKKGLVKITQIQPGGIMALWNEKNPSRAVADGSFVVEVNGSKVAPLQPTEVKRLFQTDNLNIVFSKTAPPTTED
mmetsp:Transcript_10545/g.23981  ORF Transcript_10545/g.23981 Transcript_10545/m.23981 type:complete len:172 (-) Transcript_10545:180-695(-)|eukprot:CAMPEP_0178428040 /NCGR_PEP_ID=MMETSP0689_2-20121128/30065_1 /TAXON_ID=160604 /ORGANISM="Amphidinium massartii, Strain CS-259" /LENGTH=171 /DNA_ID=CAMNT_0020049785 /DNA_START=17 /DNA_END=532 /DNA_ORIENTATION=+